MIYKGKNFIVLATKPKLKTVASFLHSVQEHTFDIIEDIEHKFDKTAE